MGLPCKHSSLSLRCQALTYLQTPLMVLIFFAPESPWWLVRRGRKAEALKSIKRLGKKNGTEAGAQETLAMMERTVNIEAHMGGVPSSPA
jgi:SP family general alpha glucoside:H+ symporter-like MFS transporter